MLVMNMCNIVKLSLVVFFKFIELYVIFRMNLNVFTSNLNHYQNRRYRKYLQNNRANFESFLMRCWQFRNELLTKKLYTMFFLELLDFWPMLIFSSLLKTFSCSNVDIVISNIYIYIHYHIPNKNLFVFKQFRRG